MPRLPASLVATRQLSRLSRLQPPASAILRPSGQRNRWLHQLAAHRDASNQFATKIPTPTGNFHDGRKMSTKQDSSVNDQEERPWGRDWNDLSTERKLWWLIQEGSKKWGWVVYRTCYNPEYESHWQNFKRDVVERSSKHVTDIGAPELIDSMDWLFIDDPALEGEPLDSLQRRWRKWVREELPDQDLSQEYKRLGPRHHAFIVVDEECLLSMHGCLREKKRGRPRKKPLESRVKIARGWQPYPSPEELAKHDPRDIDPDVYNEVWMRINPRMVAPYFYAGMMEDEDWWMIYREPSLRYVLQSYDG